MFDAVHRRAVILVCPLDHSPDFRIENPRPGALFEPVVQVASALNGPKPGTWLAIYCTKWHALAMRRVFLTRTFTRWMRKAGLTDDALYDAVSEMAQGLVDANLGGHVVKKRIALPGQGKRGGMRTIVATNMADRWFFLYGFGKNERANIDKDELKVFQEVAKEFLELDDRQLAIALSAGEIMEVCDGNDKA